MDLPGANADLAIERRLQGCVDTALRDAAEVGFAQCHVDDVVAVIAWRPGDLAGEPERGQHTARVVIGTPTDEGDHTRNRRYAKSSGARFDCGVFGGFSIFGSDEQLHLTAAGRHGREIVFNDVGAYLAYQPEEKCHAVS